MRSTRGPDDVESDAAPRDRVGLGPGGRAALEQHAHQVVPRRGVGLAPHGEPCADRGLVEAGPVVGDGDTQPLPAELRGHADATPARLAEPFADSGKLDAVIHRVPEQLEEGLSEAVEDGAVGLHAAVGDLECDLLARRGGQVAGGARQRLARFAEGSDTEAPDLVQHPVGDLTQLARVFG